MRYLAGTTDIPTAGTRVQIRNTKDRVLWLRVVSRNTTVYFGASTVSSTVGRRLAADVSLELDFGAQRGSVPADTFYVDASTNGHDVDWEMIIG